MIARSLSLYRKEDPAMLTRTDSNTFVRRVLAGLAVTVALVVGSLTHAVANVQAFI
jgi:hypothetical protein